MKSRKLGKLDQTQNNFCLACDLLTFSAEIFARVSSIFTCDWSKENGSRETSGKVTDLCPGFHRPDVSSVSHERQPEVFFSFDAF